MSDKLPPMMIIDLTGAEPMLLEEFLDVDECSLCPMKMDELHDDLVMLMNGDVVHLQCAIENRLRWQE